MTANVINFHLNEDEAVFILQMQAYTAASLDMDLARTFATRMQLVQGFSRLGPKGANALIERQAKLMKVAFPHIDIEVHPAEDGTELDV